MKKIICHVDLFQLEQTPAILENGQVQQLAPCSLNSLCNNIIQACYEENIDHVTLFGLHTYNAKLANEIREAEMLMYNKNKIEIEVI